MEVISMFWDLHDGCTVCCPTQSSRQFLPEPASSRMHRLYLSTESLCREGEEGWQVSSAQCRKLPADPTAVGIMGDMVLQVETTACITYFSSHHFKKNLE